MNDQKLNPLQRQRWQAAQASLGSSGEPIYNKTLEVLGQISPCERLLEYGAGQGLLIQRLQGSGLVKQISGADIMPRPDGLPAEIEWTQADLNLPLALPESAFDLILSTEVIEHLENPRATLREFSRLLRPSGHAIITTPNQESLRSLLSLALAGHFVDFLDGSYPAHITALLRKDFTRICVEAGFSSPQFFYTDHGGIPKRPLISWQQVSFGFCKGRLFSDNMIVLTQKL
jgi:2-polyprenyl-3-methyl-5-hydroxy-6-metoxy-1,4-benzoquinol methylase